MTVNKIGKCVTFDLTFTLIKINGSVGIQYARILKKFDYHIEPELALESFRKHYKIYNKSYPVYGYFNGMSSREWWKGVVKNVIIEDAKKKEISIPNEKLLENMSEYAFSEFCKAECWELYPESRWTLDELSKRGIKMGMISNFDERIGSILRNLDLAKYFEFVVIPHETNGLAKPNQEMFKRALKMSGLNSPDQITHVGNDIDQDYYAAKSAGFNAIFVSHDQTNFNDSRLVEIKNKGNLITNLKNLIRFI